MSVLFDIVIPLKERADYAELCLTAIRNFTPKAHPYRIYIIDNLCKEVATLKLLERARAGEFGPCTVLLGQNKSFSNSINMGVSAGDGKNIVILNSDALVTEGWSSHFLSDLADRTVGMTGARSNAAAGVQGGSGSTDRDPKFLVMVCCGVRREVYEQLGGMDEVTFDGWSGEDLDFSFKVTKQAQMRLKLSNAYVMHGLSKTLVKEIGYGEALAKNNEKYTVRLIEKWGRDIVVESTRLKPKVMIFSFSPGHYTSVAFMQQLMGLRRGTEFDFDYAHYSRSGPIQYTRQAAAESILNINDACRKANQQPYDFICMIDDDQVEIPPDALHRLIRHDKDVVGTIAYQRGEPYNPCIFELSDDGVHVKPLDNWEHTGLRKVDVIGFPMVLIKVSVFERLRDYSAKKAAESKGLLPLRDRAKLDEADLLALHEAREKDRKYFDWLDAMKFLHERDRGRKFFDWGLTGEDLYFCGRCRQANIPVHVDSSLILGHLGHPQVVNEKTRKDYLARRQ